MRRNYFVILIILSKAHRTCKGFCEFQISQHLVSPITKQSNWSHPEKGRRLEGGEC